MRERIAVAVVAVSLGFSVACGDDKTPTPTGPTVQPPVIQPPTVTTVTLTELSLKGPSSFIDDPVLEIGGTVTLQLDAEYSDGSTQRVTEDATWTSSNDHVATVAGGIVTGRHLGGAHVRAAYEEMTVTSINFRVERGYHFTIRNVAPNSIGSIIGTLENTGKAILGEDWYVQALLYEDGRDTHIAASEDRQYDDPLSSGFRKDFYIIPDTRDYDSYELRIVVGTIVAECAGCQRRRR